MEGGGIQAKTLSITLSGWDYGPWMSSSTWYYWPEGVVQYSRLGQTSTRGFMHNWMTCRKFCHSQALRFEPNVYFSDGWTRAWALPVKTETKANESSRHHLRPVTTWMKNKIIHYPFPGVKWCLHSESIVPRRMWISHLVLVQHEGSSQIASNYNIMLISPFL